MLDSATSSARIVIVAGVQRFNRVGRMRATSSGDSSASNALPFAVQCKGKVAPTDETARNLCGAAIWSMKRRWSPSNTAQSTVSFSRSNRRCR